MTDIIKSALDYLSRFYGHVEITPEVITAWRVACYDIAPEVLQEAAIEYTRTPGKRFFPSPGELLEIVAAWVPKQAPQVGIAKALELTAGKVPSQIDGGLMRVIEGFGVDRFRELRNAPELPSDTEGWDAAFNRHRQWVFARRRSDGRDGVVRVAGGADRKQINQQSEEA